MAQHNSSEEIDLGYLLKKFNDFFKSAVRSFFLVLDFFKKYIIIVIALVIIGFGLGYYKDSNQIKTYNNEVMVIPNFESVDYLYDKVETLNIKIAAGDSLFLKPIFGANYRQLNLIEIEPIVDIYNFISKSRENIDILRILAQNQDFSDYIEDLSTSKYYKYHRMKVSISGKEFSEKVISDLLAYLNSNEHFNKYQDVYKEMKGYDIEEHYKMIAQVDSLVKASTTMYNSSSNVSVNSNADQHYLIERKRLLIEDLYQLKMEMLDYTAAIKVVNIDYNLKPKKFLEISKKIKYPILLVLLFSLAFFVIYIFKNLRRYSESE